MFFILVLILIAMAIFSVKLRETSDRVDRLAEQIRTEQTLEEPTTEITATPPEPGDEAIVMELNEEYKERGKNEQK